jgi:hypothetical protein
VIEDVEGIEGDCRNLSFLSCLREHDIVCQIAGGTSRSHTSFATTLVLKRLADP